ncbi:hypothetical protein [Bartonella sp. DGB2]|uniref:hypothetical protein n=1 Tax=Bartonella sp. DGB2 TaxID=3388426 RepID=UPI00399007A3
MGRARHFFATPLWFALLEEWAFMQAARLSVPCWAVALFSAVDLDAWGILKTFGKDAGWGKTGKKNDKIWGR